MPSPPLGVGLGHRSLDACKPQSYAPGGGARPQHTAGLGLVGPESYKIFGMSFKKKETKMRKKETKGRFDIECKSYNSQFKKMEKCHKHDKIQKSYIKLPLINYLAHLYNILFYFFLIAYSFINFILSSSIHYEEN